MEIEHVILVFVLSIGAYFIMREAPSPVISQMTSNTFKISDKQYRYEYQLDNAEISLNGILTQTSSSEGIRSGGVDVVLHYLTDESLVKFKTTQNTKICNAPFFNAHAKHKQLIPANSAVGTELAQNLEPMKASNYTQTTTWRPFNLRGYCIKTAPIVEIDGKKGLLPHNMFDRCLTMVITQFKLIDQTVIAGS